MFLLKFFLSLICLGSISVLEARDQERYHQFRAKKMEKFIKKNEGHAAQKRAEAEKKLEEQKELSVIDADAEIEEVSSDLAVEKEVASYRNSTSNCRQVDEKPSVVKQKMASKSSDYVAPLSYASPAWPAHAIRFTKGDYVRGDVGYQHADRMYDSSGGSKDVSALYFGEKNIRFGDVFLMSSLIDDEVLTDASASGDKENSPFVYLQNKRIIFEAIQDRVVAPIEYIRHFWDNRLSFGIVIPVVYHQNSLKYRFDDLTDVLAKFKGATDIIGTNFSGDAHLFLDYLLKSKGFDVDKKNMNKTGLGDITCFMQWKIKETDHQYVSMGARMVLPTSVQQDMTLLWGPQLDKGYPVFSGHLAAMFTKHHVINPHLFLQVSVTAPANQMMRVSRTVEYDGKNNNESKQVWRRKLAGSEYGTEVGVDRAYKAFGGPDSLISPLAESFRDVRIAPGAAFEASFGNLFNNIGVDGLSFDVWYNLYVKGANSIQENGYETGDWNYVDLSKNTNEIRHFVGAQLAYQMTSGKFYFGGGYVVAGRNTAASMSVQLALSFEF